MGTQEAQSRGGGVCRSHREEAAQELEKRLHLSTRTRFLSVEEPNGKFLVFPAQLLGKTEQGGSQRDGAWRPPLRAAALGTMLLLAATLGMELSSEALAR